MKTGVRNERKSSQRRFVGMPNDPPRRPCPPPLDGYRGIKGYPNGLQQEGVSYETL